jgi:hypothetical protein
LAASELPEAISALTRPLDPGGWLVLALHAGDEISHVDELLGHEVNLDYVLHDPAYIVSVVEGAGLIDTEWYLRGPIATRAETTRRLTSSPAPRPEAAAPSGCCLSRIGRRVRPWRTSPPRATRTRG